MQNQVSHVYKKSQSAIMLKIKVCLVFPLILIGCALALIFKSVEIGFEWGESLSNGLADSCAKDLELKK